MSSTIKDAAGPSWPKVPIDMDELSALEFARDILVDLSNGVARFGLSGHYRKAAGFIDSLITTADSFSEPPARQDFLEDMLRRDGLSVVLYLAEDRVREAVRRSGRVALAAELSTAEIGEAMASTVTTAAATVAPAQSYLQRVSAVLEAECALLLTKRHP